MKPNHIHHFYLPTCKGIERKGCENGMLSELVSIQASRHEKLYNPMHNEDWLAANIIIHLQYQIYDKLSPNTYNHNYNSLHSLFPTNVLYRPTACTHNVPLFSSQGQHTYTHCFYLPNRHFSLSHSFSTPIHTFHQLQTSHSLILTSFI